MKTVLCLWAFLLFVALEPACAFYDPGTQRWVNRDPSGEPGFELSHQHTSYLAKGGLNMYIFVLNSTLNELDPFGLDVGECEKNLKDAMAQVAVAGANCNAHFFVVSAVNGIVGVVAGGVAWVYTKKPLAGACVGVLVGGGLESYEFYRLSKCLDKMTKMKKDAEKKYKECIGQEEPWP